MRSIIFGVAALATLVPSLARAECVPSTQRTCFAGRSFAFTVAAPQQLSASQTKPSVPAPQPKMPPRIVIAPGAATPAMPPIDCGMVKSDNRNNDPKIARNTKLPNFLQFPMNVVRTPSCQSAAAVTPAK